MVKLTRARSFLMLMGIAAAASLAVAQVSETTPKITTVSKVTTAQHQTITITGTGFGTHKAYTGDTKYIAFNQNTKPITWQAGYSGFNDTVTLIVNSWTATKITLGGFAGGWGTNGWTLAKNDKVDIEVWNAQSDDGPATSKTITVSAASTSTELRSSPNPSVYGEPVTFTAVVTSGDGVPRDGEKVLFMNGKEVMGSGTLRGGVARFTTSTLEFGANSIKAVYAGDSDFAGTSRDEESARMTHTVN
jgi:hypothetical protein